LAWLSLFATVSVTSGEAPPESYRFGHIERDLAREVGLAALAARVQ
jgi:hypothetical protein